MNWGKHKFNLKDKTLQAAKDEKLRIEKLQAKKLLEIIKNEQFEELKSLTEEIFEAEHNFDNDFTVDGLIAKEIDYTTFQSYIRYGDRNNLTNSLILQYIRYNGTPLDVQSGYLKSRFGQPIEPDDIANFMSNHDRGASSYYRCTEIRDLKKIWFDITGFKWCPKFARKHLLNIKY